MRAAVLGVLILLGMVWAPIAAAQDATPAVEAPAADAGTAADAGPAVDAALMVAPVDPAAATVDEDEENAFEPPPHASYPREPSQGGLLRSGLAGLLVVVGIGYVLMRMRGATSVGGAGWGTYYLAWLIIPVALALVAAYPLVLVVALVGFVLRPWLPDPVQYLRHARRAHSLETQVRANPSNQIAHRDLAEIWLAKRRPKRALVHLAAARARDPEDLELRLLEGESHVQAERYDEAAAVLLEVVKRDPKFRYGEAALRAGDALAAQRKWPEAERALRACVAANSSSVEAHVKLARARARQGDSAGAAAERRAARQLFSELPGFQRKKQRYWYLRALVGV